MSEPVLPVIVAHWSEGTAALADPPMPNRANETPMIAMIRIGMELP
jgi:hypothetical protein